jgi:hypothetical protein
MMRVDWTGMARKGVAGLLVLALLALSVAPASAWPPPVIGHSGEHHAVADCGSHDRGAVAELPGEERRRGHHEHLPSALACCVALQCPMLLADLQPAPAQPVPPTGLRVRAAVAVRQPAGLDIAPALPPPRDAA